MSFHLRSGAANRLWLRVKKILREFEGPDLLDAALDEGVREDSDGPIEGMEVVSTRGSTGGVRAGEGLDEIPGRGAE